MTENVRELVKRLRLMACKGCIYSKADLCVHLKSGHHCRGNSQHEAADLIERLWSEKDQAEATNTTLYRRCDAAEDKLSELLFHVTGGRYSKPTYSIAEMKIFIEDYQQCECEVCQDVAQLVRERDAAISDLKHKYYGCDACKHYSGIKCALPVEMRKYGFTCWEWRGPRAENGGTE